MNLVNILYAVLPATVRGKFLDFQILLINLVGLLPGIGVSHSNLYRNTQLLTNPSCLCQLAGIAEKILISHSTLLYRLGHWLEYAVVIIGHIENCVGQIVAVVCLVHIVPVLGREYVPGILIYLTGRISDKLPYRSILYPLHRLADPINHGVQYALFLRLSPRLELWLHIGLHVA